MRETARSVALQALLQMTENEGYSNIIIDKALRSASLSSQDAALATGLFYGVLEKRISLEYIIRQFASIPLSKIHPTVLEILRMAVYQIFFMDKIPDSAAVNEAVKLAKEFGQGKASGFVNGVLRNFLRKKDTVQLPDEQDASPSSLSVRFSCPEWLIRLWITSYGQECTLSLLKSFQEKAPLFVRVNTTKITPDELKKKLEELGVKVNPVTNFPNALILEKIGSVAQNPYFLEGLFHVQDLSSQICCGLIHPQVGETVLDICSAPGGKAFTVCELMGDTGKLFAFDKYKGKVGLIRQGAKRLGLSSIEALVRDAESNSDALPMADRVLCDVPCSGFGIIRRKPEIRYKPLESLDSLPDIQYRILCNSCRFVKKGGYLFYSTCTLNPKENREIADRFVQEHKNFAKFRLLLPVEMEHAISEPDNQFTLMPHVHGTDGFFIAAFQKMRE